MNKNEEKIIATKSLFSLTTKIIGMVFLLVFVLIPSENFIFEILDYIAFAGIAYFLITLILLLLEPKTKIGFKDKQIWLYYIHKAVAIDVATITTISYEKKRRRGLEYQFGKINIYTKEKTFQIKNIDKVEEVRQSLSDLFNEVK